MTTSQSVYARLLTRVEPERGYPLWFPEPNNRLPPEYREGGLRIGDVGVVTGRGTFDVFFNICLPENHPLHATYGVPDGFKQVVLEGHDIESIQPGDHCGRVIATQSIRQKKVTVGATAESPGTVAGQGSIGIEFSSSSNEGALLVLPEGADQHDLCNVRPFKEEALRCAKSWYKFAVTKLGRIGISANELYLITGCHKTSSWSLAAFHQPSRSWDFSARFTAGKILNGNISAAYSWQMSSAVPWRIGPQPYDAAQNQTVFIRGYKIAIRESILALLLGDVSVSYESPNTVSSTEKSAQHTKIWTVSKRENHRTGSVTNTSPGASTLDLAHKFQLWAGTSVSDEIHQQDGLSFGSDVSLTLMPPAAEIYHPSNLLLKCIMRNESDCEVRIIHDDIWSNLYRELPQGHDFPEDDNEIMKLIHKYYIRDAYASQAFYEDASTSHVSSSHSSALNSFFKSSGYESGLDVTQPHPEMQSRYLVKVIIVMGPTGAGKSSLIRNSVPPALAKNIKVAGDGFKSETNQVKPASWVTEDGTIIELVDTPGFDDIDSVTDAEVLKVITTFLTKYGGKSQLTSLIYVHRISDTRVGGTLQHKLRMFRELCGADSLKNVAIVTTMWDEVTPEEGLQREQELMSRNNMFKPLLDEGATMMRHERTAESANKVINHLLEKKATTTQIVGGIIQETKTREETTAGGGLHSEALLKRCREEVDFPKTGMAQRELYNGYNYSWTDQDAQQLVYNCAQPPHTCAWVVDHTPCGLPVFRHMFSTHLRDYHGITGNDKTPFYCQWMGCGALTNRESISRHVAEMHLQTRHTCPFCSENFSQKHTLNSHIRSKHDTTQ